MKDVDWMRRCDINRRTLIESAIAALINEVEAQGAHRCLTEAVIRLGDAQDAFADWVDGLDEPRRRPTNRVLFERPPQVAPEPLGGDRPTAGKVTPKNAPEDEPCPSCEGVGTFPWKPFDAAPDGSRTDCARCDATGRVTP
jgi:hypothetical protein